MLDDLREQSSEFDYTEEEGDAFDMGPDEDPRAKKSYWLGMTPGQRFVIAVMLLMMTCMLSTFCLMVTERISLPFM
ncbi:MAG: hypothetical protein ABFS03_01860 [Chloroflexota bacterium]